MTASAPVPLSIGSVVGGMNAGAMSWREEIGMLMRLVRDRREFLTTPVNVNAVYHVPGNVRPQLEFQGVRTGAYSKREKQLVVQVALPPEVADDPQVTLLACLREAIGAAEDYVSQRGLADGLPEIRAFIDEISNGAR